MRSEEKSPYHRKRLTASIFVVISLKEEIAPKSCGLCDSCESISTKFTVSKEMKHSGNFQKTK